jgi:o-succinylbenzoate synthase
MKIDVLKYTLKFNFSAITSRGSLNSKESFFIRISTEQKPATYGLGECSLLPGLSPDLDGDLMAMFEHCAAALSGLEILDVQQLKKIINGNYPALLFGLETALMDLMNGGERIIYNNQFVNGKISIPINGLVWMGDKAQMMQRIQEKIEDGFDCIKIKIGGIDFEDELDLLRAIREEYAKDEIMIRLDANGAFKPEVVLDNLERLARFDIHSIEQPISAGDWKAMQEICKYTPIPVALDEELIGLHNGDYKARMLDEINPQYIVIKPSLVGGLRESEEWIQIAAQRAIGWWITSALESNIGLNAIAQFTSNQKLDMPQGLGTGMLYKNNIQSPLVIIDAHLKYDAASSWDVGNIAFKS